MGADDWSGMGSLASEVAPPLARGAPGGGDEAGGAMIPYFGSYCSGERVGVSGTEFS